jgi:hypothetical protein
VIPYESREHPVAATAVGTGTAPLADRLDVVGTGENRGPNGRVVHGFAVADDQRVLRKCSVAGPE